MDTVQSNNVVDIEYTLKGSDGELIDSSKGLGPLSFIQGKKNIIPGLEAEMEGKKLGDSFQISVTPDLAYGNRDETLVQSVPKVQFGESTEKVKVGDQVQVKSQNGEPMVVMAREINDDSIVLDANHPLAGMTLHFDVEVVGIRAATSEELDRGYLQEEKSECDPNGGCC
jgi:FKBP-type peptidyl-prolyl cis-trans isomerase SlyD